MKTDATSSEEEILSMTIEYYDTNEVPAEDRFDGEGCVNLPIKVNGVYIRKGLYDSETNANLMCLTKARELGIRSVESYPYTIGYANGKVEKSIGILRNFPINIGGFDYRLDIIIANTRRRYNFALILGKKISPKEV